MFQIRPVQKMGLLCLALAAAFSLLLAACGDDNSTSNAAKTATQATAASSATVAGSATAKAEGSSSPAASSYGAKPTDTDKNYVQAVCSAFNTYYQSTLTALANDPSLQEDNVKALQVITPFIKTFGDNLAKAKPPADAKEFHDSLVNSVKNVVDKVQKGEVKSTDDLNSLGGEVKQLSQSTQERLDAAAQNVKECQESVSPFSDNSSASPTP
jgi:hypothetical protein